MPGEEESVSYEECPACGTGRKEGCPVCGGPPEADPRIADIEARMLAQRKALDDYSGGPDCGAPTSEDQDILASALAHWGLPSQIAMLAEESAELAAASMHMLREQHAGDNESAWIGEMADVSILLDQMRVAGFAQQIAAARAVKMERLRRRLAEDVERTNG